MTRLLVILALAGCGRVPTAPKACTAQTAFRVDSLRTIRTVNGVPLDTIYTLAYWCR